MVDGAGAPAGRETICPELMRFQLCHRSCSGIPDATTDAAIRVPTPWGECQLDIALYVGSYVTPLGRALPPGRILVVEDEPAVGLCLQDIVQGLGCTGIGPVGRLAAAMELARNAPIDAALLDVNLGNGDFSYPVARALEARGIPFAFVTAYASSSLDGAFCRHAIVNKPFRLAEIRTCVRRLLPDGWRSVGT